MFRHEDAILRKSSRTKENSPTCYTRYWHRPYLNDILIILVRTMQYLDQGVGLV